LANGIIANLVDCEFL